MLRVSFRDTPDECWIMLLNGGDEVEHSIGPFPEYACAEQWLEEHEGEDLTTLSVAAVALCEVA